MKKIANRMGANLQFRKYADGTPAFYLDFANSISVELTSSRTYATGGQYGKKMVGFDDPMEGTMKISTQIVPIEFVALACSPDGVKTGDAIIGKREKLTAANNKLTLANAPVAGSVYVYAANDDMGTVVDSTVANKEVTLSGSATTGDFIVYYIMQSATAESVTFSDNVTPGYYTIYGDTMWKSEDGEEVAEGFIAHKAMPQKAFSITYQGSGDALAFEMTLDLFSNEDNECYTPIQYKDDEETA